MNASAGTNDPLGFFDTFIDGSPVVTLDDTAAGAWTPYTFSFVGTGSDMITIEGATDTNYWFVDDVVVAASSALAGARISLVGLHFRPVRASATKGIWPTVSSPRPRLSFITVDHRDPRPFNGHMPFVAEARTGRKCKPTRLIRAQELAQMKIT